MVEKLEAATGMAPQPAQQKKTPNEPNSQTLTKGNNQTNLIRMTYYKRELADTADPKGL
jgi:hypothetical protein